MGAAADVGAMKQGVYHAMAGFIPHSCARLKIFIYFDYNIYFLVLFNLK